MKNLKLNTTVDNMYLRILKKSILFEIMSVQWWKNHPLYKKIYLMLSNK